MTGGRTRLARLPLRTRVALLAAVAVGLAVALTAGAAYVTARVQLLQQNDEVLLARARAAVDSQLGDPAQLVSLPADVLLAADLRIALASADGRTALLANGALPPPLGPPEVAVARGETAQSVRTAVLSAERNGGTPGVFRVVAVPATPGTALVLAQSTEPIDRTLDRLRTVSLLVGALGIVLAAWAGSAIARAGLRPVRQLSAAAEHVTETGRLDPLDLSPGTAEDDEIARLTRSFNEMLAALSASRAEQRRLVADAGHELRTPLTSLRTNLDLLAQADATGADGPRLSAADRDALMDDVRAQIEELTALVTDLVELARDDVPQAAAVPMDLADVTRRALTRVRRRAPSVRFDVDLAAAPMSGDPALLERAVTNLLDNAATYSPTGGSVSVTLRAHTLVVTDEGPGIPAADLPHVFDRFYRSPEARGRPGSGLGLAIVRSAAHRHGGTVTAEQAAPRGTRMTLALPGTSAADS